MTRRRNRRTSRLRTAPEECSSAAALRAHHEIRLAGVRLDVARCDLARGDLARSETGGRARDVTTTTGCMASATEQDEAFVRGRLGATGESQHCEEHDDLVHGRSSFRRLDLFHEVLHESPVKNDRPSVTAAWVAGCRGLYDLLPEREQLARDDYGTRFLSAARLPRSIARMIFPRRGLLYMQVRTRVIDDVMLDFVKNGGRQVVLLGAGFDCRALRFARELAGATVFEIDHPATQSKKKRVLAGEHGARTEYVAWDFESRPLSELPSELASRDHDRNAPTCTIWEGVTMYLTPRAIDETLRCVGDYSSAGSKLVFNYTDRARLDHPSFSDRMGARVVSAIGEKFRFGFDPATLGSYLEERGFVLERNAPFRELAREFFDERAARKTADNRLIAIASKT